MSRTIFHTFSAPKRPPLMSRRDVGYAFFIAGSILVVWGAVATVICIVMLLTGFGAGLLPAKLQLVALLAAAIALGLMLLYVANELGRSKERPVVYPDTRPSARIAA